jgi:hypothetical protein
VAESEISEVNIFIREFDYVFDAPNFHDNTLLLAAELLNIRTATGNRKQ